MTTFSAIRTNRTVLQTQSHDSNQRVYQGRVSTSDHPLAAATDGMTAQECPGGIPLLFWLPMCQSNTKGSVRITANCTAPIAETQ